MNSASTWPLRTVALAAEMKPRALRQWFETNVLTLRGNDRKSKGPGDHCGLSRQRAYQAAIVQHLNKLGMTVSRGAAAALQFSDCGNLGRLPGELFQYGKTILVIGPDGATAQNCFYDVSHIDVTDRAVAAITLDLNKVVEHVDTILNNESCK
jgi:hypothetical protein